MKKIASLLSVAVLAGVITLGAYKLFIEVPASTGLCTLVTNKNIDNLAI